MKTTRLFRLRFALVLLASLPASSLFAASSADRAADLLARQGAIPVAAAGSHVERGTFRIQVVAKLGQPDARLGDDTWLYHERAVEGSAARGTLIVRFTNGRVSSLAMATPAVVAALRANPAAAVHELVATR